MMNRGTDGHVPFSNPVPDPTDPEKAAYPEGDLCWNVLRPLYEKHGVNAVSFGHSNVYERYEVNGVHYVEAASIGNNYRSADNSYHPSGERPLVEANGFRSFMLLHCDLASGLSARGIQASVEADNDGYLGRVFDEFVVAK